MRPITILVLVILLQLCYLTAAKNRKRYYGKHKQRTGSEYYKKKKDYVHDKQFKNGGQGRKHPQDNYDHQGKYGNQGKYGHHGDHDHHGHHDPGHHDHDHHDHDHHHGNQHGDGRSLPAPLPQPNHNEEHRSAPGIGSMLSSLLQKGMSAWKSQQNNNQFSWDQADILGIVQTVLSDGTLRKVKKFLDEKIWSKLGIDDELFSGEAVEEQEPVDPFEGVSSSICEAYNQKSILYPSMDHDPMTALNIMPIEVTREVSKVTRTIRNMDGKARECAKSFLDFMKEVVPSELTIAELVSRYELSMSGNYDDVVHIKWAKTQLEDPDSIIYDMFDINRHIVKYIDEWQGLHSHSSGGLCPHIQNMLHEIQHDIHNLPIDERASALTFKYYLKMHENTRYMNFTNVARAVVAYLKEDEKQTSSSSEEYTSSEERENSSEEREKSSEENDRAEQKNNAINWMREQMERGSLGHRMWALTVKIRESIDKMKDWSKKLDQWKLPKDMLDEKRKMKYEVKKLTDEDDRKSAWEFKHFLWRYNGTMNGIEDVSNEFEDYLDQRSNDEKGSAIFTWFLSGIENDQSLLNRIANLLKTRNGRRDYDMNESVQSLRDEYNSLPEQEKMAVMKYKYFLKQYNGSMDVEAQTEAFSSFLGLDMVDKTDDLLDWYWEQVMDEQSLGSRMLNLTARIKEFKENKLNGTEWSGSKRNKTNWESKFSTWKNTTQWKHKHKNYTHRHHGADKYKQGKDGQTHAGKVSYHSWHKGPWFYEYLDLDLQEDIDELMDEVCTLCPVTQMKVKVIKYFFREYRGHMGENVVLDLDNYFEKKLGGFIDNSDIVDWFREQLMDEDSFSSRLVALHNNVTDYLDGQNITLEEWNSQDATGFHDYFGFNTHEGQSMHSHSDGPLHNGPMRMLMDQMPEDIRQDLHKFMHMIPHLDPYQKKMVMTLHHFFLETEGQDYRSLSIMLPVVVEYLDNEYGTNNTISSSFTKWIETQKADPASMANKMLGAYRRILAHIHDNYNPGMDETFDLIAEMSKLKRQMWGMDQTTRKYVYIFRKFLAQYFRTVDDLDDLSSISEVWEPYEDYLWEEFGESYPPRTRSENWLKLEMANGSLAIQMFEVGRKMTKHIKNICNEPMDRKYYENDYNAELYDVFRRLEDLMETSMQDIFHMGYRREDVPNMVIKRMMGAVKESGLMEMSGEDPEDGIGMCMCV